MRGCKFIAVEIERIAGSDRIQVDIQKNRIALLLRQLREKRLCPLHSILLRPKQTENEIKGKLNQSGDIDKLHQYGNACTVVKGSLTACQFVPLVVNHTVCIVIVMCANNDQALRIQCCLYANHIP